LVIKENYAVTRCAIQIFIQATDDSIRREQPSIKQSVKFHDYCCKEARVDMSPCELADTGMHAVTFSALKPVTSDISENCAQSVHFI